MKRKPRECTGCGCDREILIVGAKIRNQSQDRSQGFQCVTVTLAPLCVPCLLKAIGLGKMAGLDKLPKNLTKCVREDEG